MCYETELLQLQPIAADQNEDEFNQNGERYFDKRAKRKETIAFHIEQRLEAGKIKRTTVSSIKFRNAPNDYRLSSIRSCQSMNTDTQRSVEIWLPGKHHRRCQSP